MYKKGGWEGVELIELTKGSRLILVNSINLSTRQRQIRRLQIAKSSAYEISVRSFSCFF
jgi:hypothetical protein